MSDTRKPTSVRIPDDLYEAAKEVARDEDRSMNSLIIRALRAYIGRTAS